MKCFVWSVALYGAETWTVRRNEEKRLEAFEMWIWRRMEHVKWTDKTKNAVVLERVGEGRIMQELIKKEEKKLAGPLAKKELPAEGCSRTGVFNLLSSRANLHLPDNPAGRSHCRLQNHHGYIKHHHRGMGGSPGDVGEVPMM